MTTATRTGFTETAAYHAQMAHRTVAEGHQALVERTAADAATWVMRDLVVAETERELYAAAANTDRGEARFVQRAARYLADGARSTDAFDRAAADTQREGALRALRNLRGEMTPEALLDLVNSL